MYDVTIFLKSGQSFTVVLEKFTTKINGLGELVGFDWFGAGENFPNLTFIKLEDISAIISVEHVNAPEAPKERE